MKKKKKNYMANYYCLLLYSHPIADIWKEWWKTDFKGKHASIMIWEIIYNLLNLFKDITSVKGSWEMALSM